VKVQLKTLVAIGLAASVLGLTNVQPARADGAASTRNIILGGAALAAGLIIGSNVAHKSKQAHTVVGYLSDGSAVYADGRVVQQNGASYYPGDYGQGISCNNNSCYVYNERGGNTAYQPQPQGYPAGYGYQQQPTYGYQQPAYSYPATGYSYPANYSNPAYGYPAQRPATPTYAYAYGYGYTYPAQQQQTAYPRTGNDYARGYYDGYSRGYYDGWYRTGQTYGGQAPPQNAGQPISMPPPPQ